MKTSCFQILVGGLGGQGVLYVTRILAEAAVRKGLSVLTTETHGMAQRGGTVVSHIKVGDFWSPMIRPLCADGLLALASESAAVFGSFVRSDGWAVINGRGISPRGLGRRWTFFLDADRIAREIGSPKSVNLVLLGYALGKVSSEQGQVGSGFFCTKDDIRRLVEASRRAGRKHEVPVAVHALDAGFAEALRQGG